MKTLKKILESIKETANKLTLAELTKEIKNYFSFDKETFEKGEDIKRNYRNDEEYSIEYTEYMLIKTKQTINEFKEYIQKKYNGNITNADIIEAFYIAFPRSYFEENNLLPLTYADKNEFELDIPTGKIIFKTYYTIEEMY